MKLLTTLLALLTTLPSLAQQMNYQGRLTDTTGAPTAGPTATVIFNIWDHPTATAAVNKVIKSGARSP